MKYVKRTFIAVGIVLVAAFALAGFMAMVRGTPVRRLATEGEGMPPAVSDSEFPRMFDLFTGTHIENGNKVEQLKNGNETYPRLYADLHAAKQSITMQMYYSLPGKVADSVKTILSERSRAGVRVLLVLDAFGSQHLIGGWTDSLKAAGVQVGLLRRLRWYTIHQATDRSHVRVVVVDGHIGYTGGFGIADYWLGDGHHEDQWRETNVRFEGPAVMELQAAFAAAWAESTGQLLAGSLLFPPSTFSGAPGNMHAALLFTTPTTGSTAAERYLALTISGARKSLYITNSYFVPDDDFRRMLKQAARRGVDVRVLTVGDKTDVKTTWYAGRYRYEELLRAGVKIYEYQPTMIHSKTIVADGVWSSLGSMNFDNRSLAFNNESNVVVQDATFGAMMDSTFMDDLRYAHQVDLTQFEKRGTWEKVREAVSASLQRLL